MSGTIVAVAGDSVTVARGGVREILGFLDFSLAVRTSVPVNALLFGEARTAGKTMVVGPR